MANKPILVKISETVYGCSECKDFKIEVLKPHKKTAAEWQRRLDNHFADRLKQRHSREDVNQAAARNVRELTQGKRES